jgi:methionyl-tRNA formyltransferase
VALEALSGAGHDIALVLTQPDRPIGRGLRETGSPVKRFAVRHQLPIFQPESLKSEDAVQRLVQARADAMVVAAYGLILAPRALSATRLGALNIHASLLPRWRGAAPIQRALLAGDSTTGVSIMQMDEGLDTGPVFLRESVPIQPDDDAGTLHDKLAQLGAAMMVKVLWRLQGGDMAAVAQPAQGATYASKIEKEDTLIDWSVSAAQIERMVRAFRPSPGALTHIEGSPVKVWGASVRDGHGSPGTVLAAQDEGILVACGTGGLQITHLQRAGGRRLSSAEFLRGRAVRAGMRFA